MIFGRMMELADMLDLRSGAEKCGGSSPSAPIRFSGILQLASRAGFQPVNRSSNLRVTIKQ